ncbi:hypothetical protein AVEN_94126-1 [Araneus ventricosus]|uniref:Uncharacterized protein n=1 Tax=Araneus ventricosus TaxID=182803 RepID=A0A4Y2NVD4_ARAVE|nr:hypothetical protein AVEN_181593-1 [Araneus ventricosus]GBN42984.1 hypothetical protein AVEN_120607-1 [Araneus ventricosus]GBN43176.1 hypothetical protein AVEN_138897-1 [Araneus ventricosus]GBN44008.1 hypothetical protein AVEN_94126-1 [Araneus ventricosus]
MVSFTWLGIGHNEKSKIRQIKSNIRLYGTKSEGSLKLDGLKVPNGSLQTPKENNPFADLAILIYVALQSKLDYYALVWNGSLENGVTVQMFSSSGQHLKLLSQFKNRPRVA